MTALASGRGAGVQRCRQRSGPRTAAPSAPPARSPTPAAHPGPAGRPARRAPARCPRLRVRPWSNASAEMPMNAIDAAAEQIRRAVGRRRVNGDDLEREVDALARKRVEQRRGGWPCRCASAARSRPAARSRRTVRPPRAPPEDLRIGLFPLRAIVAAIDFTAGPSARARSAYGKRSGSRDQLTQHAGQLARPTWGRKAAPVDGRSSHRGPAMPPMRAPTTGMPAMNAS